MSRRRSVVPLFLLLSLITLPHPARADATLDAWTRSLMDALGGQPAWDHLRTVRWTFAVVRNDTVRAARTHYWDKATMRDRIEYTNKDGVRIVSLADLTTRTARTWANGVLLTGDAASQAAERSYGQWVNDSYWCFAPYKMHNAGVLLADAGDTLEVGVRYHRVRLTFDHVGLTPGDTYWFYLNATSGMMEKWAFVLEGTQPPPTVWSWDDWKKVGPIWLSATRRSPGESMTLEMRDLAYFADPPAAMYTSPDWTAP